MAKLTLVKDQMDKYTIHVAPSREAAEAWVQGRRNQDKQLEPQWDAFNEASSNWYAAFTAARAATMAAFEAEFKKNNPQPIEPGPYPLDNVIYEDVEYEG